MKLFVVFGSKTDTYIYEPLKRKLIEEGHEIEFQLISAHRSPDLLQQEIKNCQSELVIAGAGLAAHLPGMLASHTLLPVIGIPCTPAFSGIDAALAIQQMPFGIPVLTAGPDQIKEVTKFLQKLKQLNLRFQQTPFSLVYDYTKKIHPIFKEQIEKLHYLAEQASVEFIESDETVDDRINICLVHTQTQNPTCPIPYLEKQKLTDLRIHVPVLVSDDYRSSQGATAMLRQMQQLGGLWVGANNVGNAFLSALQLENFENQHSAILTNAKKGYIHV